MISYTVKVLTLSVLLLMSGCGSSSSSENQQPTLNEENIVSVRDVSTVLSEESFANGVLEEELTISLDSTDDDQEELAAVTLPSGTQFVTEEGVVLQKPPVLQIVQQASSTTTRESATEDKTSNVVKGEIKFVDQEGNKIIPTEPVEISMAAPAGSKPGDEVRVEIPDGVDKATGQSKLTLFIVDRDGNIRVIVAPQVFETLDVVVIIIEKIVVEVSAEPLTGAEGAN